MIFLTVGTQFPFDRLVRAVDELVREGVLTEEVFAQIGGSAYVPRHFQSVAALDKAVFDQRFQQATAVISHAGMGTIAMALDQGVPLLAMPRLKKHREVVNNHQLALAERFAALGHILLARNKREMGEQVRRLTSFVPKPREVNPATVADRISCFISSLPDPAKHR